MTRIWILAIWLSTATDKPTNVGFFYDASKCWEVAESRLTMDPYRRSDCIELILYATTGYGMPPVDPAQPKSSGMIPGLSNQPPDPLLNKMRK